METTHAAHVDATYRLNTRISSFASFLASRMLALPPIVLNIDLAVRRDALKNRLDVSSIHSPDNPLLHSPSYG